MKIFIKALLIIFISCKISTGQIICVMCFEQNDSISQGVNNLLMNGGFENTDCVPNTTNTICCKSPSCSVDSWLTGGGGPGTYATIYDSTHSRIVEGTKAVYFGNYFAYACSPTINDFSCISRSGCILTGFPSSYPRSDSSRGGVNGISLYQNVSGLIPDSTYVLEFWAGGEGELLQMTGSGVFSVDVGFGKTLLSCKPTGHSTDIGTTYLIIFKATSNTHKITFTNWGHINLTFNTELVLDNVRLYTLAELSPSIEPCNNSHVLANFSSSDTLLCGKNFVDFYDQSTSGADSWHWFFPGAVPDTSTLQNPVGIFYPNNGSYDITLIACISNDCDTISFPNYINEYSLPVVTTHQSNDTIYAFGNGSFQWWLDSNQVSGATQNYIIASQDGVYYVELTDSSGCKNTSPETIVTQIKEVGFNFKISSTVFNDVLDFYVYDNQPTLVRIYDLTSRLIIQQKFINRVTLSTEALESGIYIYDLRNNSGVRRIGKVIKK